MTSVMVPTRKEMSHPGVAPGKFVIPFSMAAFMSRK